MICPCGEKVNATGSNPAAEKCLSVRVRPRTPTKDKGSNNIVRVAIVEEYRDDMKAAIIEGWKI